MRAILSGRRGLSALLLPIVIAWALAAVLMLTGTLLAARQIDERVKAVTSQVTDIDRDLEAVRLAGTTNDVAEDILRQADPLAKELDEVVATAEHIDMTAGSILDSAQSINTRVAEINRTARSILTAARAINGNVDSIRDTVGALFGVVRSINSTARSIGATAGAIETTVDGIEQRLGTTLSVARSIDPGVAGINRRADLTIAGVRPIRDDVGAILFQVGRGHTQPDGQKTLHGHANSIDCALGEFPLFGQLPPPPQHCGK